MRLGGMHEEGMAEKDVAAGTCGQGKWSMPRDGIDVGAEPHHGGAPFTVRPKNRRNVVM